MHEFSEFSQCLWVILNPDSTIILARKYSPSYALHAEAGVEELKVISSCKVWTLHCHWVPSHFISRSLA